MPRNMKGETEFGLPVLPSPAGEAIAADAVGAAKITGLTDADSIKTGKGNELSLSTTGHQLREIYATGEGEVGPGTVGKYSPIVKPKK